MKKNRENMEKDLETVVERINGIKRVLRELELI